MRRQQTGQKTAAELRFVMSCVKRSLPGGRTKVDELCACGRLRSEHRGSCGLGGTTGCDGFLWAEDIIED